ncbi:YbaB/EbfC family DNA-binding protein [Mycolicibacterium celeriflavum]|uniref:YbaB/EbfC family DNA-binding protein n=1 Tax=Mycolicibacterium celeriflavum TaxID=1249101 RepID=UPI003CF7D6BB
MVDETSSRDAGDEHDDTAALDSGSAAPEESVLDILDVYAPAESSDEADRTEPDSVVTVTNPPGTVSVSALLDGRISRIGLSAKAAELTEADLADEVVVVAGLAAQEARSTQYASMLAGMGGQGHDDAATRDFLSRDLGLPSPEQARTERARVFTTRYAGGHD